jgi:hypothetical protein
MISNTFDPMPKVNSQIFKEEYIKVLIDKNRDLTLIYSIIDPFLKNLKKNFKKINKNYYFLYFLLKNINSFNLSIEEIKAWTKEKNFESDIDYIVLSRLRKLKTIPHHAKPTMAKFYFVTDLRLAFSNFLSKKYRNKKNKKSINILESRDCISYEQFFEEKINSNFWQNYLFYMLKSGYTITELSKMTGYSRTTIYKELKK